MRYAAVWVALLSLAGPGWSAAPPTIKRDALGDPLPRHALFRLGSNRLRTPNLINGVALSPDGRVAAATGMDFGVYLWDLPSGRPRRSLKDPAGRYLSNPLFSPDGRTLAAVTSTFQRTPPYFGFCLCDLASGKIKATTEVHGERIASWAFSPDGKVLAASHLNEGLVVYDARTGRKLRSIDAKQVAANGIAFSPCGKRLAVPMLDETVVFFDVAFGKIVRTLPGDKGRLVLDLAFSPGGHRLATLSRKGGLRVIDLRTGKQEWRLALNSEKAGCRVYYTEGGRALVVLDSKGTLIRIDAKTGKELSRWANRREDYGTWIGLSADAKAPLVFCEWGSCELRLVDLQRGREVGPGMGGHSGPVSSMAVSPDGQLLAAGSGYAWKTVIRLWDLTTGKPIREVAGHTGVLRDLLWSSEGLWLASTIGQEKSIRLLDPPTGRTLNTGTLQGFAYSRLAFSPNGKHLVAARSKYVNGKEVGELGVWDVPSLKRKHLIETVHVPSALAFLYDFTLTSLEGGELRFRAVETLRPTGAVVPATTGSHHETSADGSRRASLLDSREEISVSEGATGIELARLRIKLPFPFLFALSPDGERVALSRAAGRIELFDALSGERLAEFCHPAAKWDVALAFTPDGTRLLSGGKDATVLVWDVRSALRGRAPAVKPLNAATRRMHWTALGSLKPEAVRAALLALRADPRGTLVMAEAELKARRPVANAGRIERLIADLDADSFQTRQQASEELAALGEAAWPALLRAEGEGGSAEGRSRVAALLKPFKATGLSESQLCDLRAVRLLDRMEGSAAGGLLARFAKGNASDPITRAAVASLRRRKAMGRKD